MWITSTENSKWTESGRFTESKGTEILIGGEKGKPLFGFGACFSELAEHLGVDMSRTIAIGDYDNDASMLAAAGVGIAVSNASKAALAAADRVTVSNEEHAIARVIEEI